MAKETAAAETTPEEDLQDFAAELFFRRTANGVRQTQVEQVATQCFRDAEVFLRVAKGVSTGQIDSTPAAPSPLSEVCAPNLKPTHPLNMVSGRFGDVAKVRSIYERLEKNPTITAIEDYDWKEPEVKLARVIFPECLKRAGVSPRVPAPTVN